MTKNDMPSSDKSCMQTSCITERVYTKAREDDSVRCMQTSYVTEIVEHCPACGFELDEGEDSAFCPFCGLRIVDSEDETDDVSDEVALVQTVIKETPPDEDIIDASESYADEDLPSSESEKLVFPKKLSSTAQFILIFSSIAAIVLAFWMVSFANSDEGKIKTALRLAKSTNYEKARTKIDGISGDDAEVLRKYFNICIMIKNLEKPSQDLEGTDNFQQVQYLLEDELSDIPESYLLRRAEFSDKIIKLKETMEKIQSSDRDMETADKYLVGILNLYETLKRHKAGESFTIQNVLAELDEYKNSIRATRQILRTYPTINSSIMGVLSDFEDDVNFYIKDYSAAKGKYDETEPIYFTATRTLWDAHAISDQTTDSIRKELAVPFNQYKWELLKQWQSKE